MMYRRVFLAAALLLCLHSGWTVPLDGPPVEVTPLPTVLVSPALAPPSIDGKLDDPCWSLAAEIGPLNRPDGTPAEHATRARLTYTKKEFFLGITCAIPSAKAMHIAPGKRDGDIYAGECIEVFFDPGPTMKHYLHFLVNPNNVQRDEKGTADASPPFDKTWNGTWRSAVRITEHAWFAEIAIPRELLRDGKGLSRLLGLNVCRNDTSGKGVTCWAPTPSGFHVPRRFGLAMLAPAGAVLTPMSLDMPMDLTQATIPIHVNGQGVQARMIAISDRGRREWRKKMTNGVGRFTLPGFDAGETGLIVIASDAADKPVALLRQVITRPVGLSGEFGAALPKGDELGLWWADGMVKIHRWSRRPSRTSKAMHLAAAAGEYEAVQLVLRPPNPIEVTLSATALERRFGGKIPAENVTLLRVGYVPVKNPTDRFGWADDWPDPLLPIREPIRCEANRSQPIWVLVHVPADARPGIYRGKLRLTAEKTNISVPLDVEVFGFSLPAETHTRTAYGVSLPTAFLGLDTLEQKRQAYDLYLQSFRDHRIAPYSPMAYYPIKTEAKAPSRRYTQGDFSVDFMVGREHPWQISWKNTPLATQRTSMTHFEKKGVGWQGSGVGWPYIDAIESIREIDQRERLRVLEIKALHSGSGPANRSFRLTFHAFIPAEGNWFAWKLMRIDGLDPVPVTIRGYYNIPRTTFSAKHVVNQTDVAGWTDGTLGFGMLCLDGEAGNLKASVGKNAMTVYHQPAAEFLLKENTSHDGWGPLVVYFAGDALKDPKAIAARAAELRALIKPNDPAATAVPGKARFQITTTEDYAFKHDFTDFDQGAKRYLDEFGFNAFNLRCMPQSVAGHRRFTKEYRRYHALRERPIVDHLRQRGWLSKAYSYWYDEPDEKAYPYVREGMSILGWNCPGLTRLLTEQPEAALADAVDLWVPVLSAFRPETCRDRQLAGDEVWWYVCCGPRAPYPNNFIDHPGINHRIRFWMAEKYHVTGSLYWSTTYMGKTGDGKPRNPYTSPMSLSSSGSFWGNGDGFLLYPACQEPSKTPVIRPPVVSMRWELLRDGIEDREYFWLLRREITRLETRLREKGKDTYISATLEQAREAMNAPNRLAESLTVYTKNPADLLAERRRVAEAIVHCRTIR